MNPSATKSCSCRCAPEGSDDRTAAGSSFPPTTRLSSSARLPRGPTGEAPANASEPQESEP